MGANKKSLVCVSVLATLVATGCEGPNLSGLPKCAFTSVGCNPMPAPVPDFLNGVVIEPDTLRLIVGETGVLSATAYLIGGKKTIVTLSWTTSDTTIVGLSSEQLSSSEPLEVTARMPGEALVAVSASLSGLTVRDTAVVLVR